MVIFGGTTDLKALNCSWVLDLQSSTWQKLTCDGDLPSGRFGCTMTPINRERQILLLGGLSSTGAACKDNLYVLNLPEVPSPSCELPMEGWQWTKKSISGRNRVIAAIMLERGLHTACRVGWRHEIVVFGGIQDLEAPRSRMENLFCLDPDVSQCFEIRAIGKPPSPRYAHSACRAHIGGPRSTMLVVGGIDVSPSKALLGDAVTSSLCLDVGDAMSGPDSERARSTVWNSSMTLGCGQAFSSCTQPVLSLALARKFQHPSLFHLLSRITRRLLCLLSVGAAKDACSLSAALLQVLSLLSSSTTTTPPPGDSDPYYLMRVITIIVIIRVLSTRLLSSVLQCHGHGRITSLSFLAIESNSAEPCGRAAPVKTSCDLAEFESAASEVFAGLFLVFRRQVTHVDLCLRPRASSLLAQRLTPSKQPRARGLVLVSSFLLARVRHVLQCAMLRVT